jgi:lipopolysaccharide biosynthesis protein
MDVAPFLWFMNYIVENNKQYQSVLKLHSKKSLAHGFELGERWRKDLTNALLFNNYIFLKYTEDCVNTHYKMVASSDWILPQKLIGYEQNYFTQPINFYEYEFVGGTMFLANFNLIKDWFVEEDIYNKFYNEFQDGYIGDGSIAHEFERVLGCLVKLKGFEIYKA